MGWKVDRLDQVGEWGWRGKLGWPGWVGRGWVGHVCRDEVT
jgi:hypothetical protein